jgi:predicted flap endonuclease-1-like 5' DNA nuclease
MATKRKTDNTISKTIDTISQKTKVVNERAISTSNQLLDIAFEKAEKWQDLLAQTLETGVAYYGVQQDRFLTKLEGYKAQYDKGENPFADLFNFKSTDIAAAPAEVLDKTVAKAKKAAKTAAAKTTKTKKAATKKATTTKNKAKKEVVAAKKTVENKIAETQKAATEAVTKGTKQATQTAAKVVAKAQEVTAKAVAPKEAQSIIKNDLKEVKGIGPKMEEVLNTAGITTFAQLAAATPEQLEAVLLNAGPSYKGFDTTDWVKQAEQLVK